MLRRSEDKRHTLRLFVQYGQVCTCTLISRNIASRSYCKYMFFKKRLQRWLMQFCLNMLSNDLSVEPQFFPYLCYESKENKVGQIDLLCSGF